MTAVRYEITVRGQLGGPLSRWISDVEVSWADPDTTCLVGGFEEQGRLHDVLTRLGDLGIELSSVRQLPDRANRTS